MRILDDRKRRTAPGVRLSVLALGVCLLGFAGTPQAVGQNAQTLSHTVTVASDPPGATIWNKEGRDYTCTNTLTPATLELTFHGENDVKQILLRRFGYSSQKLLVDAAREKVDVKLAGWGAPFFTPSDDAPPEVRSLDARVQGEFEKALMAGNDAFPCAPFEFRSIGVVNSDERQQLELGILIDLGPSAAARALRLASHSRGNPEERLRQMGQAALEGGAAEIIARFRAVAAKFPEIKGIFLACSYSTTEAALSTEIHPYTSVEYRAEWVNGRDDSYEGGGAYRYHVEMRPNVVEHRLEETVVKDQAAVRTMTFSIPLAKIPDTGDKKAVTEAVLSDGAIKDFGNEK
jgi:hypothetical protein